MEQGDEDDEPRTDSYEYVDSTKDIVFGIPN